MIKDIFSSKNKVLSFEVFPPKKDDDFDSVIAAIDELKTYSPDFISVTYGAGGSNSKRTIDVASYIQNMCNIEALCHMTCVGYTKKDLDNTLKAAMGNDLHNILFPQLCRENRICIRVRQTDAVRRREYAPITAGRGCKPVP